MSTGTIDLAVADGVATITLDNRGVRNALTASMADQLWHICEQIDADATIGGAVVRGAGGAFCSGADRADLAEWGTDPARDDLYQRTGQIYATFVRIGALRVPTVAAVRGAAVGAGVNLMLSTDLRIVADDARILAGFLPAGIHPGGGHFVLAGRTAGREATAAMTLFGQEISGRRAVETGMAWEHVPDGRVEGRAMELAARAAKDPDLARMTVASFRAALGPPSLSWEQGLEFERGRQMWSLRRRTTPTR